jgi:hypothetical protein
MTLEGSRSNLRAKLLGDSAFEISEQRNTLELITKWWRCYKAWEERDTFLAAFKAGRMTVRQGPRSQLYGAYKGQSSTAGFLAGEVSYENERYRTGVDSIKERMNPGNLATMEGGERMKYTHGLHDLSASLCTPTIPRITKQVRWKNEKGKLSDWITIFMPVADPEDHTLFILLNLMTKTSKTAGAEIKETVRYMSKRMTRIKLAAAEDIGAGLTNISTTGGTKFRYGLKKDEELNFARFKNALDYTSILPKPSTPAPPPVLTQTHTSGPSAPLPPMPPSKSTSTNEIVLSYREHEGDRFPLFTQWNGKAFACLEGESGSKWILNGEIPDQWPTTVELGR